MRAVPLLLILACGDGDKAETGPPPSDDTAGTADTDPGVDTDDTDPTDTDPDGTWTGWGPCTDAAECDDGLACSDNQCVDGRCIAVPLSDCPWPATSPADAVSLAYLHPLFEDQLSGADYDHLDRLWLVRSGFSSSNVFRLVEDGKGGWTFDTVVGGGPANWPVSVDTEGITVFDPAEPDSVLVVTDGDDTIEEYDLSGATAMRRNVFNIAPFVTNDGGNDGSEGITFVPDAHLAAWGFTDASGAEVVSANGMGGLVFVAHQSGGRVYAFDLDRSAGTADFVGEYVTERAESAGLDFDASTGRLLIFHGDVFNDLEVARLSSTEAGVYRKLDTEYVWNYPGDLDSEGIAVAPVETCTGDGRSLWIASDDEGSLSLQWYRDWVCL